MLQFTQILADVDPAPPLWRLLLGIEPAQTMAFSVLLLLVGMALITKGGDLFTDSAVAIARATRVPPVIIGATIVSLATTFPEFMVSLTGALSGVADFAVGNALGSCCCNIGLIVGSCVLIKGYLGSKRNQDTDIVTTRETLQGAGGFMICAGVLLWLFSFFGDRTAEGGFMMTRGEGSVLAVLLVLFLAWSLRIALRARFEAELTDQDDQGDDPGRAAMTVTFVTGAMLVVLGSKLLVANAEFIARQLGVPELIVGLTILAIGTSLPEYTISLMAVIKGHGALGIGNIIGANILNICWVVAGCALIDPLPIRRQTVLLDAPVVLALMILLIGLAWRRERLTARSGVILLTIYLGYVLSMITLFRDPAAS